MSERKKFEDKFKSFSHTFNESLCIIPNTDRYYSNIAQASWEAWQASKAEVVPEGSIVVNKGDYVELRRVNRVRQQQIIELSETVKILRARRDYYKKVYKTMLGTQERENGC